MLERHSAEDEVVSGSGDMHVRLVDPATGDYTAFEEVHTAEVTAVVAVVGDELITADGDATMLVWDIRTRAVKRRFEAGHR